MKTKIPPEFIIKLKDLIPDEIEDECPKCRVKSIIGPIIEKSEIDKLVKEFEGSDICEDCGQLESAHNYIGYIGPPLPFKVCEKFKPKIIGIIHRKEGADLYGES